MNVTITGPNGASAVISTLGAELKSFSSGGYLKATAQRGNFAVLPSSSR